MCESLAVNGPDHLRLALLSRDVYLGSRELLRLKGRLAVIGGEEKGKGTAVLTEKELLAGYRAESGDLRFTLSKTGDEILVEKAPGSEMSADEPWREQCCGLYTRE